MPSAKIGHSPGGVGWEQMISTNDIKLMHADKRMGVRFRMLTVKLRYAGS